LDFTLNLNNILYCLIISLVSQLGDLFISFLKRKANIKDTGKILPGHGGILDRVDGIIFAVPFSYLLIKLI
jgi:phosphatidate cytidylyltransferase